jgi:hypothetical protein
MKILNKLVECKQWIIRIVSSSLSGRIFYDKDKKYVIPKHVWFSTTFEKYGNVHKAKFVIDKYSKSNPESRICKYVDVVTGTYFCFVTAESKIDAQKAFYKQLCASGIILNEEEEWNQFFRNRTTQVSIIG